MSGVFGVFDSRHQINIQSLINKISCSIKYRDWQQVDYYSDQTEGAGLGRIGIGIFNQTSQPAWNSARTIACVMVGEFDDIDQIDEIGRDLPDELLALRLYEDMGEQFISKLSGVFILAIWDEVKKKLTIANDRFGLYPLYYSHFKGRLVFSPEMKGILCDPDFEKKIDLRSIAEYMRFQHILGDKTFFEELKLLRNASILVYDLDRDQVMIKEYWDFSQIPEIPPTTTLNDAVHEAGRLLKASVDRNTVGNYRFGVYLSGGLDSRVILGMVNRDKFPVNTVTYGMHDCRDVVYAQRIANLVGSEHHYFEINNGAWVKDYAYLHLDLTEGFHSWIHAHGISVMDQVRSFIDVNLTGFGGGQSAIDWEDIPLLYSKDDLAFTSRLFNLLSQATTWPSLDDAEERMLYSPRYANQMIGLAFESLLEELAHYDHLPYYQRAAYFALCNPDRRLFQYFTVFHRLAFEQRFPFYDYEYLKFVYALPPEMLFKRRLRRGIILDRIKPMAKIPYDKDNLPITGSELSTVMARIGKSSKSYLNHKVAPIFPEYSTLYADYENWLRNELRDWGGEILLSESSMERGLFDLDFVKSLWERHQSGLEVNMIGKVAPIMTFEMVMRKFKDEDDNSQTSMN
ncbi:MAG: asparagine synthetase B family protein [Candidatus Kariarchaeaceae archaeon]|jgi:asparagine synthase (glutamine-hydrolysing)